MVYLSKIRRKTYPSRYPFHELDNIIMTPHSGGFTIESLQRNWLFTFKNIIKFAKGETLRSAETFQFAADEARKLSGELVPLDAAATGKNRFGYYKRYPLGVIGAITPFNFPLNLVSHKVAPAIAAGNTIVLKPASTTPLTAVRLVEILLEAGLPKEGIALVVGSGSKVGNKIVDLTKLVW